MAEKSGLDKLCTRENLIRSNYFSDTYRAELRVGSEQTTWDIIHISLPFAPLKEREMMVRFGLDKEQMLSYYKQFGRCVKNAIKVSNFLGDSEVKSVVRFASYVIERKEGASGSDIYLVTKPMEKFTDRQHWNEGDTITLLDILAFAARILQINKGINAVKGHSGVLDLDCIYMMPEGDKELVTLGGMMYGSQEGDDYIELPMAMPAHVCPSMKRGESPSVATDAYSLCSLLWSILDGKHYTSEPDFSRPPKYAPEALIPLLSSGIKCAEDGTPESEGVDDTVKSLNKGFRAIMKQISNKEIPNTEIIIGEPEFDLSVAHKLYRQDPVSATKEAERKKLAEAEAQKEDVPVEETAQVSENPSTDEGKQEAPVETQPEVVEADETEVTEQPADTETSEQEQPKEEPTPAEEEAPSMVFEEEPAEEYEVFEAEEEATLIVEEPHTEEPAKQPAEEAAEQPVEEKPKKKSRWELRKEEAERKKAERQAQKEKEEAERAAKAKAEAEERAAREAAEKAAAEERAKQEEETRKAREEEERKAAEEKARKEEEERKAAAEKAEKEEAERKAREEADRKAAEEKAAKEAEERAAREAAEKAAAEEKAKKDAEEKERREKEKAEEKAKKEQAAAEAKASREAEKKAAQEAKEAEKKAAQEAKEAEKKAAQDAKAEKAKAAAEEKEKARKAKEEQKLQKEEQKKAAKEAKQASGKKSLAIPILLFVIVALVLFIFVYFYLYPEILKPILMQHYVNEYMRMLNEAAAATAQAATAIQ